MDSKADKTAATVVMPKGDEPVVERDLTVHATPTKPQHAGDPALSALDLARLEKRFEVSRLLGAGGMGVVVECKDRVLGRDVAVKLLYGTEEEARTRFLREARAAATLRHPGIVTVHDIDAEGGFIVMELVTGGSLSDRLREEPKLPVAEVRRIATALLSALTAAHDGGIVHRDVKPGNILFDGDGGIKLADFGIASFGDSQLTSTGTRIGTPAYMAPEQLRGHAADARADIYAAGATLFEAATGTKLHREEGRVRDPAAEVRAATGDEALAIAIAKAVAEHASDRYATARELADALRTDAKPRAPTASRSMSNRLALRRSRMRWITITAVIAIVAATAVIIAVRRGRNPPVVAVASPVVAILPFVDHTSDPRLDFAALGLPNLIAGELRGVRGLGVIDSYELRDRLRDLDAQPTAWVAAARERGANLIVRGEIDRAPSGVRITATVQQLDGTVVSTIEREAAIASATSVVHELAGGIATAAVPGAQLGSASNRAAEIERMLQLGIAAAEGNDLETANRLLDEVVAREPLLAEAHAYRALVLEWLGKPAGEILASIEKALAGSAIDPAKRTFLEGLKLLINRRYHEAVTFFRAAEKTYPDHRDILYGLFEALFHGDDPAAGIAVYRRLCELSPRFKLAIYHSLAHYIVRGDVAGTDWALARADEPTRLAWRVNALLAQRDYPKALDAIDRKIATQLPRVDVESWQQKIATLLLAGKLDLAAQVITELETKDPTAAALPRWSLALARGEAAGSSRDTALRAPAMHPVSVTRFEGWLKLATLAVVIGDAALLRSIADGLEASRSGEPGEIAQGDVGRALLGGALDDAELMSRARRDGFIEAVSIADGFAAAKRNQHAAAIAAFEQAIGASTDGRFIAVTQFLIARSARAAKDSQRAALACREVVEPRVFGWEWGAAASLCRVWLTEAKSFVPR